MKNVELKFPLIEDITMNVAKQYGMIQPGESSKGRESGVSKVLQLRSDLRYF